MRLLEERIQRDGVVKAEGVLKVDSFLNHQMDISLFNEMGAELKRLFADAPINKILTIEASGIGIAAIVAQHFGVPVVFAKKAQSINLDGEMYTTRIQSFTHGKIFNVIVSKKYIGPEDHVLIIDDFLANGCALDGLIEIVESAGATVEGIGIAIEKGFQPAARACASAGIALSPWPLWTRWTLKRASWSSASKMTRRLLAPISAASSNATRTISPMRALPQRPLPMPYPPAAVPVRMRRGSHGFQGTFEG